MALKFNLGPKIATGLLGASAIGTGSYFTYEHLTNVSISDHITKNDLVLLTAKDTEKEWLKRWAEYIQDDTNKWNIKGYDELKKDFDETPKEFKEHCLNSHSVSLAGKEETLYKEIANWCTKSKKVSELISSESVTLLDTTAGNADWINAWKRYAENDENHNPLGLADWKTDRNKKGTLPADYIKKCEAKKGEEAKNKKDESYLTFKIWCTKA